MCSGICHRWQCFPCRNVWTKNVVRLVLVDMVTGVASPGMNRMKTLWSLVYLFHTQMRAEMPKTNGVHLSFVQMKNEQMRWGRSSSGCLVGCFLYEQKEESGVVGELETGCCQLNSSCCLSYKSFPVLVGSVLSGWLSEKGQTALEPGSAFAPN